MLLSRLAAKFPILALWCAADAELEKPFAWSSPAAAQLPQLLESLYEGGWALFFFAEERESPLQEIQTAPFGTNELKDLLNKISAGAAISSWYDNVDWILVISDSE